MDLRAPRRCAALPVILALVLLAAPAAYAQQKLLSLDDIYDPQTRIRFGG